MPRAKKEQPCEKHPEQSATETCHNCDKKICPSCQSLLFGRSFCSLRCILSFVLKRIKQGVLAPLKWSPGVRFRTGLELIIFVVLLFSLYKLSDLRDQVRSLHTQIFRPVETVEPDTTDLKPVEIVQPVKGGMVTSNRFTIHGRAESNWILSLSIDGKLNRVLLPKEGEFSFDQIKLHRGENLVEVRALNPDGEVYVLQTLKLTYGAPTLNYLSRDLKRGPTSRQEVALTFDGGSLDNITGEILDLLHESEVQATFFLTGNFIRQYPKTVKRIAGEGHLVGNHTWAHPHLTSFADNRRHDTLEDISRDFIREELEKTAALYQRVTGKEMAKLWRAPYGEINAEILTWAAEAGYKHVGWTTGQGWRESMDTMDWVADKTSSAYHTTDEIVGKILDLSKNGKNGASGAIILMHLGSEREDDWPHLRLPDIIGGLREEGYALVTVQEMLKE